MKRDLRTFEAALLTLWLWSPPALAQGKASLNEAQKSYAAVDYEATRALASEALERGGNDRASTGQLYLLWATAAAALDHSDEARRAFVFALATNPALKLDRSLSPKMRAPYLEARGALSGTDGKPPLEVTLQRRKRELELGLHDTLQVAASILLATRADETLPFVHQSVEAAPVKRLPTPQGAELQFFLQVLDRHGNVLFELGTEDEPRRLALLSSSKPASLATRAPSESDVNPTPYYVTAGALGVLGLASGGVATAMYLRRESAAREWNGPGCERAGSTRGEQCAALDERRQRAENLAIGFTAAGGALLLGSVVSLIVAPSARPKAEVAVVAGPGACLLRVQTPL